MRSNSECVGGKYCVGNRVRHRSCNTHDCPWQATGFREQQCASFNNNTMGIHGVPENVKWVAKYDGSEFVIQSTRHHHNVVVDTIDRCVLYCQVDGSAAHYKLADKVIDGTPCGLYSDDICVDGVCQVRKKN
jgi:hypothetical protein